MMWSVVRLLALQALLTTTTTAVPSSRLTPPPRGRDAKAATLDYCSVCRPPGSPHTMCLYPPGPGPNCTGYRSAPLSDAEKRTIVRTHNVVRSRVANGQAWAKTTAFGAQPQAANMHQLHWDEELAAIAQRWADQCLSFYTTNPHDGCRDTLRFPVGQNIVTTAFSKPVASNVRARCLDWYGELLYFDPQWVDKFAPNPDPDPIKQIGHYTQMVWGWSYAIGCARVVFTEQFKSEQKPWTIERLVCNYAPSGNYLGEALYAVGPPCSQCPNGTVCSKRYPGLCALTSQAEKEDGVEKPSKTNPTADKPSGGSKLTWFTDFFNIAAYLPASWRSMSPVDPAKATRDRLAEEAAILEETKSIENGTRNNESFKLSYVEQQPQESDDHQEEEAAGHAASTTLEEVRVPASSEEESLPKKEREEKMSIADINLPLLPVIQASDESDALAARSGVIFYYGHELF